MANKNKVILIGSLPPPYHGSNVYFDNFLKSKIKTEFDVTHLDISDHRNIDNLSRLDVTNVHLSLKNIIQLISLVRKKRPQLVYIPISSNLLAYIRDGLFILVTSYFSRAEIVIHLHEGNYFRERFFNKSGALTKFFITKSLAKVNTAIVYSESLRYVFEDLVSDVVILPNGVSTPSLTDFHKMNNDKTIVSFYGNLFESKGVLDVLRAASIVIKKFENVKFRFVGAWKKNEKTKDKAKRIIKENNLDSYVEFFGVLTGSKKESFLIQTDIIVFPTWYEYEGCPLVILEAMSYARPVISTKNVGTISDIVIDGQTGLLIEQQSPVQIAKSINDLIENPEKRREMGNAGRMRFEKFYTLDNNINGMVKIFKNVLNLK